MRRGFLNNAKKTPREEVDDSETKSPAKAEANARPAKPKEQRDPIPEKAAQQPTQSEGQQPTAETGEGISTSAPKVTQLVLEFCDIVLPDKTLVSGVVDWSDLHLFPADFSRPEFNALEGALRIDTGATADLGTYAARDIAKGDVISVEAPILFFPLAIAVPDPEAVSFFDEMLTRLSKRHIATLLSLPDRHPAGKFKKEISIILSNAGQVPIAGSAIEYGALFLKFSKCRHRSVIET